VLLHSQGDGYSSGGLPVFVVPSGSFVHLRPLVCLLYERREGFVGLLSSGGSSDLCNLSHDPTGIYVFCT
jgi:hypothetical protein